MDGILEKQNPVSITKYRDFQNSTPEIPQNEGSNGDFYFDEVEIDADTSAYGYMYANAVKKHIRYDDETLKNLIKSAQNNNERDLEKVLEAHLLVPFHIFRKYFSSTIWDEDLIQVGNEGILKAIRTFDTESGVKFSTYLYRVVISSMHNFLKKVNPRMTTMPPDPTLRKYISTTNLRNLITNFVDIRDLKQRITQYSKPIQEKIYRYVLERRIEVISFEENEEEVFEFLNSDTSRDYVNTINGYFLSCLQDFYDFLADAASEFMHIRRFHLYCEFYGLFGFEAPENPKKWLKMHKISKSSIEAVGNILMNSVYYNEKHEVRCSIKATQLLNSRGYYLWENLAKSYNT